MAWYMVGVILMAVACAHGCGWAAGVNVLGAACLLWFVIQCVGRALKDPYFLRDARIAELEGALRMTLLAMTKAAWEDGPSISESIHEAHDVLHRGNEFEDIECPICRTKGKAGK